MAGTSLGGVKAAKTRGHDSLSRAGKAGAKARTHQSRVEGGKKAAMTIGHAKLSAAGKKGAEARFISSRNRNIDEN
jgi:hypothetical protein